MRAVAPLGTPLNVSLDTPLPRNMMICTVHVHVYTPCKQGKLVWRYEALVYPGIVLSMAKGKNESSAKADEVEAGKEKGKDEKTGPQEDELVINFSAVPRWGASPTCFF